MGEENGCWSLNIRGTKRYEAARKQKQKQQHQQQWSQQYQLAESTASANLGAAGPTGVSATGVAGNQSEQAGMLRCRDGTNNGLRRRFDGQNEVYPSRATDGQSVR